MGLISNVIQSVRSAIRGTQVTRITCDPGGGANKVVHRFSSPGDDSIPLPNDYMALLDSQRTGNSVAVGYLDPADGQLASVGEKRIYSRNSEGEAVATMHLKNDASITIYNANVVIEVYPSGKVTITNGKIQQQITDTGEFIVTNAEGFFKLLNDGTFNVNGVTINSDGDIVVPTTIASPSMVVDGKELRDHTHPGDSGGTTGPNN